MGVIEVHGFEDQSLSNYSTHNVASSNVVSNPSLTDSYSLEIGATSGGYSTLYTESETTPSRGDEWGVKFYAGGDGRSNAAMGFGFGAQSSGQDPDGTWVFLNWDDQQNDGEGIGIAQTNNRNGTTLNTTQQSIDFNTVYRVEIEWRTDDQIVARLYVDSTDNHLATVSAYPSSSYLDGNGTYWSVGNNQSTWYYDNAHLIYPPSAPSSLSATVDNDTQISLSWNSPSDWGDEQGGYNIYRGTSSGSYSQIDSVGSSTTTYTDSSLNSGTTYYYVVEAYNSEGTSPYSNETSPTTHDVPEPPTSLTVSATTEDELDLSWDEPSSWNGDADEYIVYKGQSSDSYDNIMYTASLDTSYTDTGLEDGEEYYYAVRAENSVGVSDYSNEVSSVTILPGPSSLALDTSVEGEITVSWTNNDDSSDGSIDVYRSTDGSLGSQVYSTTTVSTTSFTDTGLDDGERYYYTIQRSTDHTSSNSSQVDGVTPLPAPTNLTATTASDSSIDVSWTANHNYGETVIEYKQSSATSWTTHDTVTYNTTSTTITGLTHDTSYDVRVTATTEHTSTLSSSTSTTTYLSATRNVTSHSSSITSTAERGAISVTVLPTSHVTSITSSATKTQTYTRETSISHSDTFDSSAIRNATYNRAQTSHTESIDSWAYTDRTSLEVIDFNVEWSDDESAWYTNWFQEQRVLGSEDELALISDVVPHAKEPCATIYVQYDGDGNGIVDEVSDSVNVGRNEKPHVVTGVPLDEDGYYRLKITNYSGYNSIYTLNIGFVH